VYADSPIKKIINHIIVVRPLENQEWYSKGNSSRRAKSESWERMGVALGKV
jgi:hypothetical protein